MRRPSNKPESVAKTTMVVLKPGIDTAQFLAKQPKRRAAKWNPRDVLSRLETEVTTMKETGFEQAQPQHFVGLYYHLHKLVYGVAPTDLERKQPYMASVAAAKNMLAKRFEGDALLMAEWMRWVWMREARRRKANPGYAWRVSWRSMFLSMQLFDDWNAARQREAEREEVS